MTLKADVIELCKTVVSEYDDWSYVAGAFKNKSLKHTELFIDPLWVFSGISALAQPVVGLKNKKIEKVRSVAGLVKHPWSFGHSILYPGSDTKRYSLRIRDIEKDNAEEYLRTVLEKGFDYIKASYDCSSEANLLANLPHYLEGENATKYCIARILIGDFDYIEHFYNDEIPTDWPNDKEALEKIIACLPDFKANFARTGAVL